MLQTCPPPRLQRAPHWPVIVVLSLVLVSCGRLHFRETEQLDAGVDAPIDTGQDSGADDSGIDAGSMDSGFDAGSMDSGIDAFTCECPGLGALEMETGVCLAPPAGLRTRTRLCLATCLWGAWGPWSACSGTVCPPSTVQPCGTGGFQVCSAAGTWCQCNPNSAPGTPGGWAGCRGSGLLVCGELVDGFPCYWGNHPRCVRNDMCAGTYSLCNVDCPAPTSADACACPPAPSTWGGCTTGGCTVCRALTQIWPCYFRHHFACTADSVCPGTPTTCGSLCPTPTVRDFGSLTP